MYYKLSLFLCLMEGSKMSSMNSLHASQLAEAETTRCICSSRKGTVDTATYLANGHEGQYVYDGAQAARLEAAALTVKHKQLSPVLRAGVGFHYAAMEQEDRVLVEQLFLERLLPVSCLL